MAEQKQPKPVFDTLKHKRKGVVLDDAKRLAAVLRSQGITRAVEIAGIPDSVKAELAKLCGKDGTFVADARSKAEKILDAHYDSLKATVERTPGMTVTAHNGTFPLEPAWTPEDEAKYKTAAQGGK